MGGRQYGKREARVDLHIHSKYSDGSLTPEDIIEKAFQARLKAISITDHDCIDAISRAHSLGEAVNIEVISGVELSTELKGKDIHILGYDFDPKYPELLQKLAAFKETRYKRAKKIVKNLNGMGVDLRFDTVEQIAGEGSIGRPHIADALLKEELIDSFRNAFERYLGYDSPAYVEKMKFLPEEAFALIRKAGGVPILAHPEITQCDEHIPQFMEQGLMGLEVWHSEQSPQGTRYYKNYCIKRNLVMTGGSDCHGYRKAKPTIGALPVPHECVDMLKQAREAVRKAA